MITALNNKRFKRFLEFHRDNPEIYRRLVAMSHELRASGKTHWGIRNLWQKLRYDLAVATDSKDYRLNDHYTPFYARLIMKNVPALDGFFEVRGDTEIDWASVAQFQTGDTNEHRL